MSGDGLLAAVRECVDATIRPKIQAHGGDISVDSVSPAGVVYVTFRAACRGCGLQSVTAEAIRQAVLAVPGVNDVEHSTRVSEHARKRLEAFALAGESSAFAMPLPLVSTTEEMPELADT